MIRKNNMKAEKKILIVATSAKTQGGISSVINAHKRCSYWNEYTIKWLETHIDGNKFQKLLIAISRFFQFIFIAPAYDLIHIHLSEPPSTLRKFPFFLFAKIYRKKTIIHFHSFDPQTTINSRFKSLYKFIFSHTNKVIVLSESWKRWIQEYLGLSENIIIIHNPCTTPIATKSGDKKPIILYAGAINNRKGYKDLIQSFSKISHQCADWTLILAGTGEIAEGERLVAKLGLSNRVFFPGWVRGEKKESLFLSASIFCLPSYAEGFPMAILDACSYGLPFITTPVGGIPDIITHGENGLLFQPGDIDSLTKELLLLITNESLRNKLGSASLKLARTTFCLEEIGKEVNVLYNELLNKT